MSIQRVCIFCGSSDGASPRFAAAASAIGAALARSGRAVVYGGSSTGLMGRVADAALAAGGEVIGVLPSGLFEREIAHPGLTELVEVQTMLERKERMADLSHAFVTIPGGLGTMDELFEVLTWGLLDIHHKPMLLLNVDGYYDALLAFLDHGVSQGLIRPAHRALLDVTHSVDEVVRLLDAAREPAPDTGPAPLVAP